MHIKLISDIICPWCYVGKRRLTNAIRDLDVHDQIEIEIGPYELYPETWIEGRSTDGYKNKGDVLPTLVEAGKPLGIDFRFDIITKIPNTLRLHSYLMSVEGGDRNQLKDVFLDAFFGQGKDLTDAKVVADIAQETLGKDTDFDLTSEHLIKVQAEIQSNRDRGVRAVPSFIINNEHIISGAIETGRWRQFFKKNLS